MICRYFKRIAVCVIAASILLTVVFSTSAATLCGDANLDGTVDVRDATYLQKVLVGLEDSPRGFELYAEAYEDGKLSVRDATAIQMYCAEMIDSLPYAPYNEPATEEPTQATNGTDEDGWNDGIFRP